MLKFLIPARSHLKSPEPPVHVVLFGRVRKVRQCQLIKSRSVNTPHIMQAPQPEARGAVHATCWQALNYLLDNPPGGAIRQKWCLVTTPKHGVWSTSHVNIVPSEGIHP